MPLSAQLVQDTQIHPVFSPLEKRLSVGVVMKTLSLPFTTRAITVSA